MWADIFTELKPLIFSGLALHENTMTTPPSVYPSTLSLLNMESLRQLHQNHSRAESMVWPKIRTFPSHGIIQEFLLYRLALWLLVTGAWVISCKRVFMAVMYKCLLVWTGYLWLPSHPLEGGSRNPGLGSGTHPQWSSRSSVWAWPQEAFWSPVVHPSCSHALPFLFPLPMGIFIPITWAIHSSQNMFLCLMFPWALPSIKPGKLLLICQTPNHFSSSRKRSQTTPITCSSIVLQNRVHNSLVSLRILITILMAKH